MEDFALPPDCPYSIRRLYQDAGSSTWLIREKDSYGEYPNIFVKLFFTESPIYPSDIFLSDTGTGLSVKNLRADQKVIQSIDGQPRPRPLPGNWNIASLLRFSLNPYHLAPYTILTTHCHYDHICGIKYLLELKNADVTVFMSNHDKAFLTPWNNLQKNSLCDSVGIKAPKYEIVWVEDEQVLSGRDTTMSIKVLHTPGHTPDSISWYDSTTHTISVGDMLYEKESSDTRSGSHGRWSPEPSMPVMFNDASNLEDWTASMYRLLKFVNEENRLLQIEALKEQHLSLGRQNGHGHAVTFREVTPSTDDDWSVISTSSSHTIPRVQLSAAHVTVQTDAALALRAMLSFMKRVISDQVPRKRSAGAPGEDNVWLWDDAITPEEADCVIKGERRHSRFSVQAPWAVVHP